MPKTKDKSKQEERPDRAVAWDRIPLSRGRAEVLSQQSGVPVAELEGRSTAELADALRFRIDPELLLFRRVCGRVVRKNLATGLLEPVAGATVHVLDTDCWFFGIFPVEDPWWWLWPVKCSREEIASVVTDECGDFCVYVPRWEIDWILRWRLRRRCFFDVRRPSVRDVIDAKRLWPEVDPHLPPGPGPDPGPELLVHAATMAELQAQVGPVAATEARSSGQAFGDDTSRLVAALDAPATELPGPSLGGFGAELGVRLADRAAHVVDAKAVETIGRADLVGPFVRCVDVFTPEVVPIFDVPDITFQVTQDVDGDGVEEVIYDEGYFDVRWNSGPIPDVTLVASQLAIPNPSCDAPEIECQGKPAVLTIGLMPLEAPYHDVTTGFALRPNQPRGLHMPPLPYPGDRNPPAQSPYCLGLQLHGCHHIKGATKYRLRYRFDSGTTDIPFTGMQWWNPRLGGGPSFHVQPDPQGWMDILPESQVVFPHWLLNWESWNFPNGTYHVTVQVADSAYNPIAESAPVAITIDNSYPVASIDEIRWRVVGSGVPWGSAPVLPPLCPVIHRGSSDIEVRVRWSASGAHLRDASTVAVSCDNTPVALGAGTTDADHEHWHTSPGDNSAGGAVVYDLSGHQDGAYTFGVDGYSRSYNPDGADAGPGLDFLVDHAYLGSHPRQSVAIVS